MEHKLHIRLWIFVYVANNKISVITDIGVSGVPRSIFGGVRQIQLRTQDRENGDVGVVAPLVRGSGGSCNLVQEISFHIVKFS